MASASFISSEIHEKLRQRGSLRTLKPAEILFALGDHGTDMFLIESGAIDLYFDPNKRPKRLVTGDLFGELAFIIGNHLRTGTAVAAEPDTQLRVFNQQTLAELLETMPKEMFNMARDTCSYLVSSERELISKLNQTNMELEFSLDHIVHTSKELSCYRSAGLIDNNTGLFTRHCILMYLERLAHNTELKQRNAVVLLIQLQNMERVSEALGKDFELKVFPWVCSLLKDSMRLDDFPYRADSECIGILLPGANRDIATKVATDFLAILQQRQLELPSGDIHIETAIGGAEFNPSLSPEVFLDGAQQALHSAIEQGAGSIDWMETTALH